MRQYAVDSPIISPSVFSRLNDRSGRIGCRGAQRCRLPVWV